jgi:hypothetical protein
MIAGYNLQQEEGILTPNEPIRCHVEIPNDATPICMRIDPQGNFVLFCDIWSHPEGTVVNFKKIEWMVAASGKVLLPGKWEWFETLAAGVAIFHIFIKGKLEIVK